MLIFTKLIKRTIHIARYSFAQSSRDIERQMLEQRLNRFRNQKSLKKFNTNKPEPKQQFPKPTYQQYTIKSMRQFSNLFPQYLLSQIMTPQSGFSKLLQDIKKEFWKYKKEEGLELLLFMDAWGLCQKQVMQRWCQNQQFSLEEIFSLLKTSLELEKILENPIIQHLHHLKPSEYDIIFKILNLYRLRMVGSQTFFKAIESNIIEHIKQLSASNLAKLIVHYANNINEEMQTKLKLLNLVEERIYQISQFFNVDELLSVLYCYIKLNLANDMFLQEMEERILLNIYQFNEEQLKKLILLTESLEDKKQTILSHVIHRFMTKQIPRSVIPLLFVSVVENSLTSENFLKKICPILNENIFNIKPEEVAKCAWAYAIIDQPQNTLQILNIKAKPFAIYYRKIIEIIKGGLKDYTVKDMSMIVWALCVKKFEQNGDFWQQIQFWFQQQISKNAAAKQIAQILWAYTNQRPLTFKTIDLIKDKLLLKYSQLGGFEVSTISWFFASLQISSQYLSPIIDLVRIKLNELNSEMSILELIKCIRFLQQYKAELDDKLLLIIVNRVQKQLKTYQYEVLVNLLNVVTLFKIKQQNKVIRLTIQIYQRIQHLKTMQTTGVDPPQSSEDKIKKQLSIRQARLEKKNLQQ